MKKITSVILTLSTAAMLSVVGAAAADAATLVTYQSGGHIRTGAQMGPGKTLYVKDYYVDGYGARAIWYNSAGTSGTKDNNNGGGGDDTVTTIPGSGTVHFKACIKDGSATIACSPYEVETY